MNITVLETAYICVCVYCFIIMTITIVICSYLAGITGCRISAGAVVCIPRIAFCYCLVRLVNAEHELATF
jgi:hypothetical protein